jgi:hypothetical protein
MMIGPNQGLNTDRPTALLLGALRAARFGGRLTPSRSAARSHSSCPPTRVVLSLVFAPDTYKLRTSQVGIGESVARDTRIIWSIRAELR